MDRTKKECILVEAAKIFARFGFKKTSIDEIAREAGVGKGTVYLAAESKEDLYYQVLHRDLRAWTAECAKVIDHRRRADELLAELMHASIHALKTRPMVRELLFGETTQILPEWHERLDELRALGRANLIEVLRLGVQQKLFRRDLDVDVVASLLQDFNLSAQVLAHKRRDGQESWAKRTSAGLSLVLDGLRAR